MNANVLRTYACALFFLLTVCLVSATSSALSNSARDNHHDNVEGSLFRIVQDSKSDFVETDEASSPSPFVMEGGGPLQNSYWPNVNIGFTPTVRFYDTSSNQYRDNDPGYTQWAALTIDTDSTKYFAGDGGIGAFSPIQSNGSTIWRNDSWSNYQATPVLYKDWMIVSNCWRGISDPILPFCSVEQWNKKTGALVGNFSYNVSEHVIGDLIVPSPVPSQLGQFYFIRGDHNVSDQYNSDVNTTLVAIHIDETGITQLWERPLIRGYFFNSFGGTPPTRVSVDSQGNIYINSPQPGIYGAGAYMFKFDLNGNMLLNVSLQGTTNQAPCISPSEKFIVNQILFGTTNGTISLSVYDSTTFELIATTTIRNAPAQGMWVATGPTSVGYLPGSTEEFVLVSGRNAYSLVALSLPNLEVMWQVLNSTNFGGSDVPPVITADGYIFHLADSVYAGDEGLYNGTLVALEAKSGAIVSEASVNFLGFVGGGSYSPFSFDAIHSVLYFGLSQSGGGVPVPVTVTRN